MRRIFVTLFRLVMPLLCLHPKVSFAQCLQDKDTSPQEFVKNFFDWYKGPPENHFGSVLILKKACITPELLKWMEREHKISSLCPDEIFLGFDPIIASNGFAPGDVTFKVRKVEVVRDQAKVQVKLHYPEPTTPPQIMEVLLVKDQYWQIADFQLKEPKSNFYSLSALLKGIDKKSVERCMQENRASAKRLQEVFQ